MWSSRNGLFVGGRTASHMRKSMSAPDTLAILVNTPKIRASPTPSNPSMNRLSTKGFPARDWK